MADFSKRIAVLALAAAAGCADSFDPLPGPVDRFYYPIGLAVRRLPAGNTALLVVSTNFDLRYDYDVGGVLHAVDPDASGDALDGDPTLAVLGSVPVGSFGGEVDYMGGSGAGWDEFPDRACPPLTPKLATGAAKVVVASRGANLLYTVDMDAEGRLACGDGCAETTGSSGFDPYGVTTACASQGTATKVAAYLTHLRSPNNLGWITQLDLLEDRTKEGHRFDVFLGTGASYTTLLDGERLYVSTRLDTASTSPLRWLNVLQVAPGEVAPLGQHNVAADVKGALTRKMAVSSDGTRGYLMLELFDYDLALSSGVFNPSGGALAVYDITESALATPKMRLLRVVPTCLGSGELEVLARPGQRDLVALTCDLEGALLFYDDEVGTVVHRIGLDPGTGAPVLGKRPFGLAREAREAGRCTPRWNDLHGPTACARLYVAAFDSSWVNLVELDPGAPAQALLAKRIGTVRD